MSRFGSRVSNNVEQNAAYLCVDRHVKTWRRSKVAIYWEGEPGDTRVLSYSTLYLPMIPELPVSMLACARIGATHTVIFSGFSAQALAERVNDTGAKLFGHCRCRLPQGEACWFEADC